MQCSHHRLLDAPPRRPTRRDERMGMAPCKSRRVRDPRPRSCRRQSLESLTLVPTDRFPSAREAAAFQKRYQRWLHRSARPSRQVADPGDVIRFVMAAQPVVTYPGALRWDDPAHRRYGKRVTARMVRRLGFPITIRPYPIWRQDPIKMNVPQLHDRATRQQECWERLRPDRDYPWEYTYDRVLATWSAADALTSPEVVNACLAGADPETAMALADSGVTFAEFLAMHPTDRWSQIALLGGLR